MTRDQALAELTSASERLARLPPGGRAPWLTHEVAAGLHAFLAAAAAAEAAGVPREELRAAAQPARSVFAQSSLVSYAQTWPLGHVGDFEIIERLLDVRPTGEPGTLARVIDTMVLQLPIVWQHRAKVVWQASLVRRRLRDDERVRVLSIGCGGSRDLVRLEEHELARLDVTLMDREPGALELSRTRLQGRVASLALIAGNALRVTRRASMRGPFDVIIVGGLLDHLSQRAAQFLIGEALEMLAVEGTLGASNIATGNPWRLMLELVCDWPLVERSAADLTRLLDRPGITVDFALDEARLTWLVTARRPLPGPWGRLTPFVDKPPPLQ